MDSKIFIYIVVLFFIGCDKSPSEKRPTAKVETLEKEFNKGPISVEIKITPSKPTLADQIDFDLTISTSPKYQVFIPEFGATLGRFFYIYSHYKDPWQIKDEKKIIQQHYKLEALKSGTITIPVVELRYQKGKMPDEKTGYLAKTDPIVVEIAPLDIEQEETKDIYDIRTVISLPKKDYSRLIFLSTLVLLIVGFSHYLWRKRKKNPQTVEIHKTPEEVAWESLEQLLKKNYIEKENYRSFYFDLTMIVREYIENKYLIKAPGQTTEEFLEFVVNSNHFDPFVAQKLRSFLQATDIVKYAAHIPQPQDVEKIFTTAKTFMNLDS